MKLFKKSDDLLKWIDFQRKRGKRIGFVPTMGALHQGHISLIDHSKNENDITICSIFINPTQFNDPADFQKYPVTIEEDIFLLEENGCDILFLPSVKEVYPDGIKSGMHYDIGFLETVFEGKFRPGHFQGVCMVVHRLLNLVAPDNLYLGQKDYQQCKVISRLIELIGMENQLQVIICPTLREDDGLAMSSRNKRLNLSERQKAATIYRSMNFIKENLKKDKPQYLKEMALNMLSENGFRVEYIEIADAKFLLPVVEWNGTQQLVILAAAFLNEVRLIDNLLV